MTRNDIEQGVYRRTGKNTTPVTDVQTRIRAFVNQRHRRLLSLPGARWLREDSTTFSSVASQFRYALPNVARINRIYETTNDRVLTPMSLEDYRALEPDAANHTGTPQSYVLFGYQPFAKIPADASELFVKSTSASDTTPIAYLEGEITGNYPRSASVTLTGTTAVTLSSAITTWVRIHKFYLSAAPVGVVTLHEDSGSGTELARIGIGQTMNRYVSFFLWPTPASAITYTVDYTLEVTDLAQNTDEPRLPQDFHYLLELGATLDELGKTDDPRYVVWRNEYDQGVRDLKYWLASQAASGGASVERSRLGAWYPAGGF